MPRRAVAPRYVCQPRPAWEPPRFVIIDAVTGSVLSKHATEGEAMEIAEGMNSRRR